MERSLSPDPALAIAIANSSSTPTSYWELFLERIAAVLAATLRTEDELAAVLGGVQRLQDKVRQLSRHALIDIQLGYRR